MTENRTATANEAPKPQRRGFGGPPGAGAMMPAEKAKNVKKTVKRLVEALRPQGKALILVFIMAICSTVFSIVAPKVLAKVMDILIDGLKSKYMNPSASFDFSSIGKIILQLALIYVISAGFSWVTQYTMAGISQKTVYKLRQDVDKKLTRLPLKFFDQTPRGDILSRITNDMDNIAMTLQQSLTQLITSLTTILGILIMMLTISPLLTLISVITLPIAMGLTMLIAKFSQKNFSEQWASTGRLNGQIEEMYTGHNIVKLYNHQEDAKEDFRKENEKLYKSSFRAQFISGIVMPAMNFINNCNYVIICVLGGIRIINGTMSLGDVTAFISYSKQFTMPIAQTASILNTMQSTIASAERVFELLDEQEEIPDSKDAVPLLKSTGRIRFNNVSFRYTPDVELIEDMNLDVQPGQMVAIVGPTGAGKTTLVNLLMRFYEIGAGSIEVDGVDIRNMTRENLRSCFGMVLQDTWLFNASIRDNIAYGATSKRTGSAEDNAIVSTEDILAASKAAYVHHFVKTLPEGYDTVLTDEASNISQGQKQLLTIARAFLADPSILILDEATSSVDTRTEILIQKAMAKLMKGRTSFVIAHRLSTIRDADIILVMKHGRIVEQGTHESLLEANGFYADLYNSQFKSGLSEAI
jgi:ATP-binding cassette, subfamily B, multidrug efflux pump